MSQLKLLELVLQVLRGLGVPHMLVGSYASSYHGESRSTHDIDLVVDLPRQVIIPFLNSFDRERYYISRAALEEGRVANVIDTLSGDKLDLFFLSDTIEAKREFSRRLPGSVFGIDIDIATVEDTVLAKLRWDKLQGGSDQQRSDVRNMLRLSADSLDWDYLWKFAGGNLRTLEKLAAEANEQPPKR